MTAATKYYYNTTNAHHRHRNYEKGIITKHDLILIPMVYD